MANLADIKLSRWKHFNLDILYIRVSYKHQKQIIIIVVHSINSIVV